MAPLFDINGQDFLKVRISVRMLKCNYSCNYCVAGIGQSQVSGVDYSQGGTRNTWGIEGGRALARKAAEWAASLPYRVGVRYDVHGEPFLNNDVMEDITWLTQQESVAFVEIQTNGSLFKKKLPKILDVIDASKLKLFCTFHHTEVGPEDFLENVGFASDLGFEVTVNALLAEDNVAIIKELLKKCRELHISTSADFRFPGFEVPVVEEIGTTVDVDKRARHFLSKDPIDVLLEAGDEGIEVFKTIAESGPLGKQARFFAALLVGLYGKPGRECSAGHDYIVVDNWGDVYPCSSYADTKRKKLGSVLEPGFVPKLREETYAPCEYRDTCHQKEEYGNLKILREHRDLKAMTLNCFCGDDKVVDSDQLFNDRMTMIDLARENLDSKISRGEDSVEVDI